MYIELVNEYVDKMISQPAKNETAFFSREKFFHSNKHFNDVSTASNFLQTQER